MSPRDATATGDRGTSALDTWPAPPARHFAIAALMGLAWGCANALGWWLGGRTDAPLLMTGHFVYEAMVPMLLLVPALAAADAATVPAPDRLRPYAFAAIAAAVGGEFVFIATSPWLGLGPCHCAHDQWPLAARTANMLPDSLLICGFITAGYRYWRRAARRNAAMHAAELEHARVMRQTQESRLQAMQACIEPQFLFETLADVDRMHPTDPRTAVHLLDDLIVYLRAALPHLRESTSTVAKESELVTAYLNIQRLRRLGRLRFRLDVEAAAHDARMPPMLLLPLLARGVVAARGTASSMEPLWLRIAVTGAVLRVTLRAPNALFGAAGDGIAAVDGVRERLRVLYGAAAGIVVDDAQPDTLTMEIPHERPIRDPR